MDFGFQLPQTLFDRFGVADAMSTIPEIELFGVQYLPSGVRLAVQLYRSQAFQADAFTPSTLQLRQISIPCLRAEDTATIRNILSSADLP